MKARICSSFAMQLAIHGPFSSGSEMMQLCRWWIPGNSESRHAVCSLVVPAVMLHINAAYGPLMITANISVKVNVIIDSTFM